MLAAAGVAMPGGGLCDRHRVAREHVLPIPYVVKHETIAAMGGLGLKGMAPPHAQSAWGPRRGVR